MSVTFHHTIPILRIFDEAKAREFYIGFLGFHVDWEHRFEDNAPLYAQISRGNIIFHLSEHHGDASPGSTVFIDTTGLEEYHRELNAKKYKYYRPGIQVMPWNAKMMQVGDPFGNRIRFQQPLEPAPQKKARSKKSSPTFEKRETRKRK